MSMQHDEMEFLSGLENTPAEQNSGQVVPNLLKVEECLLVARRLLGVIQDETKALKTFTRINCCSWSHRKRPWLGTWEAN